MTFPSETSEERAADFVHDLRTEGLDFRNALIRAANKFGVNVRALARECSARSVLVRSRQASWPANLKSSKQRAAKRRDPRKREGASLDRARKRLRRLEKLRPEDVENWD